MELQLTFETRDHYLVVRARGPWEPAAIDKAIARVREEADRTGIYRILIDALGLAPAPYPHHKYLAGKRMAEAWGREFRVVFLRQQEFSDGLVQNAATNRGAAVRVLSDPAEAITWLLQKPRLQHSGAAIDPNLIFDPPARPPRPSGSDGP